MKVIRFFVKLVVLLALLVVIAFAGMSGWSRLSPPDTGLVDGALRACPDTPNCVSSQATQADKQVAPLPYRGDRAATEAALRGALMRLELENQQQETDYWRSQAVSLLFRFIDDVEFLFDDQAQVIHVRSASRSGYSDRGVNQARVEALREAMAQ
jgi:uncharacterized protein (DUF1499 family)